MPLIKGYSRDSVGANIKTEMSAGRGRAQSLAIALSEARRAKQGLAHGGMAGEDEEEDDEFTHMFAGTDFGDFGLQAPDEADVHGDDHYHDEERADTLAKALRRRRLACGGGVY